jgi:hypothetical protein
MLIEIKDEGMKFPIELDSELIVGFLIKERNINNYPYSILIYCVDNDSPFEPWFRTFEAAKAARDKIRNAKLADLRLKYPNMVACESEFPEVEEKEENKQ